MINLISTALNSQYDLTTGEHTKMLFLRDGSDNKNMSIEALVASGDCFITLATSLDQTYTDHVGTKDSTPNEVEAIVSILLYLQRNYKIVRKSPEYRQ